MEGSDLEKGSGSEEGSGSADGSLLDGSGVGIPRIEV